MSQVDPVECSGRSSHISNRESGTSFAIPRDELPKSVAKGGRFRWMRWSGRLDPNRGLGSPRAEREKVTALIPAFNESANLRDCIESVSFADEILVVDSGSNDSTVEIARAAGARVLSHPYEGYAAQNNWAIPQAAHPWVFLIDADERCSAALRDEVLGLLARGPTKSGYWVFRRNFFLGKEIRHSGWSSDRVIRLFRRECRMQQLSVHPHVDLPLEETALLSGRLDHFTLDSLDQFFERRLRYARWWSKDRAAAGRKTNGGSMFLHTAACFLRMYVFRLGFLDGVHGLVLALLFSGYTSHKYILLWDRLRPQGSRDGIRSQGSLAAAGPSPLPAVEESGPVNGRGAK